MKKSGLVAVALFALSLSAFAAEEYKIDPVHSSVTFNVRHMGISNVPGRFSDVSGTILLDEKDLTKSSVTAVIKTASIDTNNANRDNDLKGENFFDTAKYPEATFKSTRIEKRGDQYVAIGNFTLKDVTKQIELPFELTKGNTPFGPAIGITTSITINRQDCHVTYNRLLDNGGLVVANNVKLDISLEAKPATPAKK